MGELTCSEWRSGPVLMAEGFLQRLRGLWLRPPALGLLLQARSVHTHFFPRTLWAIGIDSAWRVTAVACLPPFRIASFPGASRVLELPETRTPPQVGWHLLWLASPDHGPHPPVATRGG